MRREDTDAECAARAAHAQIDALRLACAPWCYDIVRRCGCSLCQAVMLTYLTPPLREDARAEGDGWADACGKADNKCEPAEAGDAMPVVPTCTARRERRQVRRELDRRRGDTVEPQAHRAGLQAMRRCGCRLCGVALRAMWP